MNSVSFDKLIASVFHHGLPVPHDLFDEFLALAQTQELNDRIGDAQVANTYQSSPDNHWCDLPDALIPFMWVRQPEHFDYYCFDTKSKTKNECSVAVFAVHTVVHDWPSFQSFLQWLTQQETK